MTPSSPTMPRRRSISGCRVRGGETAATDIGSEFGQLSSFVRANVIGGIGAWPNLRDGMFATFGAAGKPSAAIPRINVYYARLVEANFPPVNGVSGRKSPVHPNLKTKLDAAVALLNAKGQSAVLGKLKSAGGFAIRKNANDASKLSNHSFGWALDLDPEFNPNVSKTNLPLDLILKITGVDVYGAESVRLRTPQRAVTPGQAAVCYRGAAALFPPSTVKTAPVVLRASARLTNASATSSARTSRPRRLPAR